MMIFWSFFVGSCDDVVVFGYVFEFWVRLVLSVCCSVFCGGIDFCRRNMISSIKFSSWWSLVNF